MLDYATQKQILDPILRNPKNHVCADCDTISPTWASLDFGVFLCSNCSGAHRALGPTITRVRSANLDKWQNQWINNMVIGNQQINKYWESDPQASIRKPKIGATLNQIGRYVFQKYVKKKFVKDLSATDPLTSLKNGTFQISKKEAPVERQQKASKSKFTENKKEVKSFTPAQPQKPKVEVSLLQFDFDTTPTQTTTNVPQKVLQHVEHDDDQFSDFTQAGSTTKDEKNNKDDLISFDTLLNQQKQPQPQTLNHAYHSYNDLKPQNHNFHHHPYNPMIAQHNLVYNAQFHPQQQYHQYQQYPQMVNQNYTYNNANMGYQNQVGVGNYWK